MSNFVELNGTEMMAVDGGKKVTGGNKIASTFLKVGGVAAASYAIYSVGRAVGRVIADIMHRP